MRTAHTPGPSRRTFTPEQRRWIERWHGAPVVVLTDAQTARAWARRLSTRRVDA